MMKIWQWTQRGFEYQDSVPASDRGFRYGMALFETIRVQEGVPQFVSEHLDRLRLACFRREFAFDLRAFSHVDAVLRTTNLSGVARLYVTAGDGTLTAPPAHCRIILMLETRDPEQRESFGLTMCERPFQPLFGGLKTANYWGRIDALEVAQHSGFDEALIFNESGELISASMANVFLVHGDRIRTPILACGARDGVTRAWVMERTNAIETSLFPIDVLEADEVFLTSSWIGVMPVHGINTNAVKSSAIGMALRQEWKALP